MKSCALINQAQFLKDIKTPVLLSVAEKDMLVDNNAIRRAAKIIPHARLLEIAGAHHEILMETDDIRQKFFQAFEELLSHAAVRGQVKPF